MKSIIEKVTSENEREVIQFLTITTLNDAPNKMIFPDPLRRIFQTFQIGRAFTRMLHISAERYLTRDETGITAVGMWLPPGASVSTFHAIRYGLPVAPFVLGFRAFFLMMKLLDVSSATRDHLLKDRKHWYLLYLAQKDQGGKFDHEKEILDYIFQESAASGEAIFTHCFSEEKKKRLEKAGFMAASKVQIAENCIMYSLIRNTPEKSSNRKIKKNRV